MNAHRAYAKACDQPGRATAEGGVVLLEGPDGIAVTMTAEAAVRTAQSLQRAAAQVLRPQAAGPDTAADDCSA